MLNVYDIINNYASSFSVYIVNSCDIWHGRLRRHVNFLYMKKMVELSLIPKLPLENHGKCESCVKSKTTKKSCKIVERESNILSLIHSDLGLKNTMTRGYKWFYITFIDDYSRYTRVYILRNKDEARDDFIKYKNEVENQLSKKIKKLRTDKGEEYESNPFNFFVKIMGSFMKLLLLIPLSLME